MVRRGLDVYKIYRQVNESLDISIVEAFGKIISTLEVSPDGSVAWLKVNNSLISRNRSLAVETDAIIYFARAIRGVQVAILFKETKKNCEVRINFRSTGKVDVNKLANKFGGGGHKMASGATVKGRLSSVIKKVTAEAFKGFS